ncbi:glycosyltransferase family 9 protein [Atopomonas sediminilitoris]|uniref:glycosyltransferase family 9 protein n=1 Tax=Atopomonas sediminilitoris TaxID=2919919 RepID=UPI001F4E7832|nr:glycosyltransferase family 9 protein [Atopomonas sediminilitoris]MCJ8170319.1 ADP-heptose--LPS heptosyltransferase [Atopomonas sediminilitoris]
MTGMPEKVVWAGKRIAIVPCLALGDVTLFVRLAWLFHQAGAQVRLFANTLYPAASYFPWLEVLSSDRMDLVGLASEHDLVVSYVNWLSTSGSSESGIADPQAVMARSNIAFVSAKKIPSHLGLEGRVVTVAGVDLPAATRGFCTQSKRGWSMAQWLDEYALSAYGLQTQLPVEINLPPQQGRKHRRVAIFPTTPQPSKNYSLKGFAWLARRLQRQSWQVDIVAMPHEQEQLQSQLADLSVCSFANVAGLIEYLVSCEAVISNDSGGGHLGSLLGLQTFTLTRKDRHFVWRPGFNARNTVVSPLFTFKWLGRYVWRPFVPVWRVARALGEAG